MKIRMSFTMMRPATMSAFRIVFGRCTFFSSSVTSIFIGGHDGDRMSGGNDCKQTMERDRVSIHAFCLPFFPRTAFP